MIPPVVSVYANGSSVFPAYAGLIPRKGKRKVSREEVFPAYAGLILSPDPVNDETVGVFPAYAGLIPKQLALAVAFSLVFPPMRG